MLHELLFVIVLAMLGLLAVLASTVGVRSDCGDCRSSAKSHVSMLEDAVNHYLLAIGSCPTTAQGLNALLVAPADLPDPQNWTGPYLDKPLLPLDPWNNPYQYEATSDKVFRIWSKGPDGTSGSNDDISTVL
jgi:general secretion pathway protein G